MKSICRVDLTGIVGCDADGVRSNLARDCASAITRYRMRG